MVLLIVKVIVNINVVDNISAIISTNLTIIVVTTVIIKYIIINYIIIHYIVLYLYIYIALFAVHTNQKRFQCERPRETRAVLGKRKEALGSPVNK